MAASDKPDIVKPKDAPPSALSAADRNSEESSDKHDAADSDTLNSYRNSKVPREPLTASKTANIDTGVCTIGGTDYLDFGTFDPSLFCSSKNDSTSTKADAAKEKDTANIHTNYLGDNWVSQGFDYIFHSGAGSDNSQKLSEPAGATAQERPPGSDNTREVGSAIPSSADAAERSNSTDKLGDRITRNGSDVTVENKDGTKKFEKHGDEQSFTNEHAAYEYNRKTEQFGFSDKHGTEIEADKNKVMFRAGEHAMTTEFLKVPPKDINTLGPGRHIWHDQDGNAVIVKVIGEGDDKVIAETMGHGHGKGKHDTMTRIIGKDYVTESMNDRTIVYDKHGKALFQGPDGKPLSMSADELKAQYDKLPPGMQHDIDLLNQKLRLGGVEATAKGFNSDNDCVERDANTGNIRDKIAAKDGEPAQTVSIDTNGGAHMGIDGHTGIDIGKDNVVKYTDWDGHSGGTYNMTTGCADTPDVSFSPDGTNLKYANTYVDSDGSYTSTGSLEPGSPAYTQLVAAGATAGNKAVDMASFVASRIGSEAITSGMVDSLSASAGSLSELRAICIAHGVTDALGPIDQGLSYIASILPQAQAMAALGQGLSARGQSGSEILSAQKEMGTKTAGALLQEASFQ